MDTDEVLIGLQKLDKKVLVLLCAILLKTHSQWNMAGLIKELKKLQEESEK
jgi:hypothetical protein